MFRACKKRSQKTLQKYCNFLFAENEASFFKIQVLYNTWEEIKAETCTAHSIKEQLEVNKI